MNFSNVLAYIKDLQPDDFAGIQFSNILTELVRIFKFLGKFTFRLQELNSFFMPALLIVLFSSWHFYDNQFLILFRSW